MKVNNCLILGAGFGTRMGEIGRKLPKILWPVFEKPLIDLQINHAKKTGAENIYVNGHYLGEQVKSHIENKYSDDRSVKYIHEEQILGTGGAIHNVAKLCDYKGNLLLLNGDQFLMLNESDYILPREDEVANLYSIKVRKKDGYNELVIEGEHLQGIRPADLKDEYMTYSGVGIVNLDLLEEDTGESSFFETVADYKRKKVRITHRKNKEYWDFGTLDRYYQSMILVLKKAKAKKTSSFIEFLLTEESFTPEKLTSMNNYNCKGIFPAINLTENKVELNKSILISGHQREDSKCVIFNDVIEKID